MGFSLANTVLLTFPQRISTFFAWGLLVGVVFFSIYPTTNWLASLRSEHLSLFVDKELGLPFIPEMIWAYLSMYVLFAFPPVFLNPEQLKRLAKELIIGTIISGIIFATFPAKLGFIRTLPDSDLYRTIFQNLFYVDQPYNLVPSLHVVYSTAISLAIVSNTGRRVRGLIWLWLGFIITSTVLVHQHHVIDVMAGLTLAVLARKLMEKNYA